MRISLGFQKLDGHPLNASDDSPAVETIPDDESIYICSTFLDCDPDVLLRMERTLAPDELSRAAKFHLIRDRNRYIASRGILRELLATCLDKNPRDLEFVYGPTGKPSLRDSDQPTPRLQFNVSHSHGLAVFAIARDRNLGIDVEFIRPGFEGERIAERYFSAREVEELRRLPAEERTEGFFNCWTRKEAYIKADGNGLQIPLNSFGIALAPGVPARFLQGVPDKWHLACPTAPGGYVSALVYDGPSCEILQITVDHAVEKHTSRILN